MELNRLNLQSDQFNNEKIKNLYFQMQQLLEKLTHQNLPAETVQFLNQQVDDINLTAPKDPALHKLLRNKQNSIIKKLETEHKLVPKNYYRNLWLAVGMAAFGLPLGVTFGLLVGNIGLMAIGLPIVMAIGVGLGISMDKKALKEGRQIDIELKY